MSTDLTFPPEDSIYRRYSSHYEFPLAGATSLVLHAVALSAVVLGTMAYFLRQSDEAAGPARMMIILAPPGDGGDGGGGGSGDAAKSEMPVAPASAEPRPSPQVELTELQQIPTLPSLPVEPTPAIPTQADATAEINPLEELRRIEENARIAQEKANAQFAAQQKPPPQMPGVPRGTKVGTVGTGLGTGTGPGQGPGTGPGNGLGKGGLGKPGVPGNPAAKAQIFANRWHFDLAGTPREHANKAALIGMTLAIPDGNAVLVIKDLRQRPVQMVREPYEKYKDAVQWQNVAPASIGPLARELQIPRVPDRILMFLPKDREEQIAAEELRFAEKNRRPLETVRRTQFDFVPRADGSYEPVAVRQE